MRNGWNYAPDSGVNSGGSGANSNQGGQSGNAGSQGQASEQAQGQGLTFDSWIAEQPDDVQDLLEGHTSGLRSALESERAARKDFERKIKELSGKAEKGSEFEKQLAEIAKANERISIQAEFYEQAHAAGVSNLKLAFIVAEQDQLINSRGAVNFEAMRKSYPELFGGERRQAAGNAGAGTNQTNKTAGSMNDFIRKAAGR